MAGIEPISSAVMLLLTFVLVMAAERGSAWLPARAG